jgi:hypothetical protein
MIIIGIDPGITGAISTICSAPNLPTIVEVHDVDHSLVSAIKWLEQARKRHPEYANYVGAVIEGVSAMPTDSATNAFEFGSNVGALWGACVALKISVLSRPRPADWKRAVGIVLNPPTKPKKPKKADYHFAKEWSDAENAYAEAMTSYKQAKARYDRDLKTRSRNRAMELYPMIADQLTRVKDSDRAEAVLLAHFGLMQMRGKGA